ncbi:orotate phosphoribosyltransferase [Lederbergia lenta]|uniref:Orotate phosphoribosyltransferase n=1 Tax=Lederbergia lenta TaxID=1467 RepID=A0A2X4WP78_LEDLE|nr:orotate phosphoribosyltransferase [Lederbergia lenta]MEC2324223.1 orotate phosphoribosyltransferase [Lederbergia lenta]SQI60472.1 orotate phosphoribosyltransferase [Lederbergia lenta]
MNNEHAEQLALQLLEIEAVFLRPNEPFTWSSGLKSPIYCDNRLTLSYPDLRKDIATGLVKIIKQNFPDVEVIAGTATAGIPHAAWVSDQLNLPMCYVRSSAKSHGKGNQIEGKALTGQKVVIIEDLISTGGSVINAAEALRSAGCEVLGVAAIFSYELDKGKELLEAANIQAKTLIGYSNLINVALEKKLIEEKYADTLKDWRVNPEQWGNQRKN